MSRTIATTWKYLVTSLATGAAIPLSVMSSNLAKRWAATSLSTLCSSNNLIDTFVRLLISPSFPHRAHETSVKLELKNWHLLYSCGRKTLLVCGARSARDTSGVKLRRARAYVPRQFTQFASSVAWRFINLRYCKPINKRGLLGLSRSPSFLRCGDATDHGGLGEGGGDVRRCIPVKVRVYFRLFVGGGMARWSCDGHEAGQRDASFCRVFAVARPCRLAPSY